MITLFAAATAILDLAIVVRVLALFHGAARRTIAQNERQVGILIIFLFSVLATAGSLYLQYGMNLQPCLMCWWQRVFMYPLVIISLVAFIKNVRLADIADYILWLAIPGAAIAFYQHLLQMLPAGALIPCDASGDCAVRSVFEFGFITLPWMALTVFVAIALIAFLGRKK